MISLRFKGEEETTVFILDKGVEIGKIYPWSDTLSYALHQASTSLKDVEVTTNESNSLVGAVNFIEIYGDCQNEDALKGAILLFEYHTRSSGYNQVTFMVAENNVELYKSLDYDDEGERILPGVHVLRKELKPINDNNIKIM